ncbi:hypothetical protein [Thioalkalivibrio sp. ALE23]|uniref:hypothetical protein n=1 Tax=Thioalkalivibrio sp. ALE23 TaxID=1265495 RepID=UPI000364D7ED|nr:hypothetical protein [Thioalkalivibrio sp. ALE23]
MVEGIWIAIADMAWWQVSLLIVFIVLAGVTVAGLMEEGEDGRNIVFPNSMTAATILVLLVGMSSEISEERYDEIEEAYQEHPEMRDKIDQARETSKGDDAVRITYIEYRRLSGALEKLRDEQAREEFAAELKLPTDNGEAGR